MLHWLGIEPSYSRPRVSDDNAFAEALFRTAKYRPEFPVKGFADLDSARHWAALRHPGAASCRAGWPRARRPPRGLPGRTTTQSATLEWVDPQLETGWRRHSQSGARHHHPGGNSQIQLSGSIGKSAFPSRPGSALAAERNAGEGRSRATRSHAQSALAREHGEAGEHRTFSAVSTVAHSSPVRGSHLRTSTPQAQQHRR